MERRGGHTESPHAAATLCRQEQATTHLRRRVPLNLERLPACNMRGESRFCEQNIGPDVRRWPSYTASGVSIGVAWLRADATGQGSGAG